MQNSLDVNSASIGGLIQPIRHHVGDPAIEKEVFALQPNQISAIIPVGNQFAILKCEAHIPARNVPLDIVRDELADRIKEDKLRDVAAELFKKLQDSARFKTFGTTRHCGSNARAVVATVNGEQIPYKELADECLLRHGKEVLEVEISHLLLQQALAKQNSPSRKRTWTRKLATPPSSPASSTRMASPTSTSGCTLATKEQGITKEQYMRDSVWPSAALKKLTDGTIQVTDDDIEKGF